MNSLCSSLAAVRRAMRERGKNLRVKRDFRNTLGSVPNNHKPSLGLLCTRRRAPAGSGAARSGRRALRGRAAAGPVSSYRTMRYVGIVVLSPRRLRGHSAVQINAFPRAVVFVGICEGRVFQVCRSARGNTGGYFSPWVWNTRSARGPAGWPEPLQTQLSPPLGC